MILESGNVTIVDLKCDRCHFLDQKVCKSVDTEESKMFTKVRYSFGNKEQDDPKNIDL